MAALPTLLTVLACFTTRVVAHCTTTTSPLVVIVVFGSVQLGAASTAAASGDGDGDGAAASGDGAAASGDGAAASGDGDGAAASGDGDGAAASGDGDGDGDGAATSGDGDGDGAAASGDGDGDGDGDGAAGGSKTCTGAGGGNATEPPVGMDAVGDGTPLGTAITVAGFLVDVNCYNLRQSGICAPDQADVAVSPWNHNKWCLELSVCKTYYIVKNTGTSSAPNYTAWWALDQAGNEKAVAMLAATTEALNWSVIVKGVVNSTSTIAVESIERCGDQSAGCDGCKETSSTTCGVTTASQVVVSQASNFAPASALMLMLAAVIV